jgi:hypothetical protein
LCLPFSTTVSQNNNFFPKIGAKTFKSMPS